MLDASMRSEFIEELNLFKRLVNDSYREGEVCNNVRVKLLNCLGEMKSILLSDNDFSKLYKSPDYCRSRDKSSKGKMIRMIK